MRLSHCILTLLVMRGSAETISTAFSTVTSGSSSSTRLIVTVSSRSDVSRADWWGPPLDLT